MSEYSKLAYPSVSTTTCLINPNLAILSYTRSRSPPYLEKARPSSSRRSSNRKAVPVFHHLGFAPIAMALLMLGFLLLLLFVLSVMPWGYGRGCWAQC